MPTTVRGGALFLKGSHSLEDGWNRPKIFQSHPLKTSYQFLLLSGKLVSMESTFKSFYLYLSSVLNTNLLFRNNWCGRQRLWHGRLHRRQEYLYFLYLETFPMLSPIVLCCSCTLCKSCQQWPAEQHKEMTSRIGEHMSP